MSLINDMLSNLEKRGAESSPRADLEGLLSVDEAGAQRRERFRQIQNAVISVALILVIGLPLGLLMHRVVNAYLQTPAAIVIPTAAVAAVAIPVAVTAPVIPVAVSVVAPSSCRAESAVASTSAVVDDADTPMGMDAVVATDPEPTMVDNAKTETALPAWATATVPPATKRPRVTVAVPVAKPQPVSGPPQMKITPYQPDALTQALQVLQSGDAPRAISELKTLQQSRGNDLEVVRGLARAYLANGDKALLLTWLPIQLKQWPNDSELRLMLARTQLQSNDARSAVATLEQSPPLLAQEPAYYALLAACYQQTAQWRKSAALYEQLTQLRPAQAAWQLGLGIALERLEQPADAVRHYRFAERGQGLDDGARRFASERAIALAGK